MSLYEAIVCFILARIVTAFYQPSSNVTLLTKKNLHHVVNTENIWVVNFYTSKTKINDFAKEFALSADILKGVVKFGAIDIEDDEEFAKTSTINTKHLPIVKFYGLSNDGNTKEYTGAKSARDLVDFVLANILEKVKMRFGNNSVENVMEEVNDDNFDEIVTNSKEPWMIFFYAPWCIHCKELKPIWYLVASTLQGKIKCASIDATINKIKANEYKIEVYPTMKLFPFETKSPNHVFEYSRDRTVDSIVAWALQKLPAPVIVQLTNVQVFVKRCINQNLCVISVLPPILDCPADCRKNYLKTLQQLSERFKRHEWGWIWTEASAQKGLESVFNIGGFGYPVLVVLNPVKTKYAVFKGAFIKSRIEEFLTKLDKAAASEIEEDLVGKISTVEAWDGKDSINEELYSFDRNTAKDEL